MKKYFLLLPAILFCFISFGQIDTDSLPKNTIMITPLSGWFDNTKPSIYYKRLTANDDNKYVYLRTGIDILNTFRRSFDGNFDVKGNAFNLKLGFEFGKMMKRISIYAGPEISFSRYRVDDVEIIPTSDLLFFNDALFVDEWNDSTAKLSLFSLIGFGGVRFHINHSIQIGIESALAIGWHTNENRSSFRGNSKEDGSITQLIANRFITLGYNF